MLKGSEDGSYASYIDHIGLYFFFVACAGVSIIVWVFNWICWKNQCCCCDFLHNPINKRLVWWISFTFLLGLLACCVSGFVTTRRFGFCLYGTWCSVDRLYYDTLYGELKSSYPKWEGLDNLSKLLGKIQKFVESNDITSDLNKYKLEVPTSTSYYWSDPRAQTYTDSSGAETISITIETNTFYFMDPSKFLDNTIFYYTKVLNAYYALSKQKIESQDISDYLKDKIDKDIKPIITDFQNIKREFLEEYYYYAKILRGWGKVLTMIYFSLLLIAVVFSGVSMMF